MPTEGLSLVGYMDQPSAIAHLKQTCVPAVGKDDAALQQDWSDAKAKLGSPIAGAGYPSITPISNNDPYIQNLMAMWGPSLQHYLAAGAYFAWVDIEPLLAYQVTVDKERSEHHCNQLSASSTQNDVMTVCLPNVASTDAYHASQQGQSFVIKSRSLNLALTAEGPLLNNCIGVQLGWRLPFVHVVEWNGRSYLHNGFHRCFGAMTAGQPRAACLFRKVNSAAEVGINPPATLPERVLVSSDPPTLGHFAQGRAYDVKLRAATTIVHVSWSQHIMYDE